MGAEQVAAPNAAASPCNQNGASNTPLLEGATGVRPGLAAEDSLESTVSLASPKGEGWARNEMNSTEHELAVSGQAESISRYSAVG